MRTSKIDPILLPNGSPPQLILVEDRMAIKIDSFHSAGILVARVSEEGPVCHVRSICGVYIRQMTEAEDGLVINQLDENSKWVEPGAPFSAIDSPTGCLFAVFALRMDDDLQWCVD